MAGFEERLKDAMTAAGMESPADLAKKCGFSRQTAANLMRLDSGDNVRGKHLKALSDCLGVRMRWLMEGDEKMGRTSVFASLAIERATHLIDQLPEDKVERWLDCGREKLKA